MSPIGFFFRFAADFFFAPPLAFFVPPFFAPLFFFAIQPSC